MNYYMPFDFLYPPDNYRFFGNRFFAHESNNKKTETL